VGPRLAQRSEDVQSGSWATAVEALVARNLAFFADVGCAAALVVIASFRLAGLGPYWELKAAAATR
jgi:hypothetical protein